MITQKIVQNRIRQLCHEKSLSINALAVASGIHRSTLKGIMYGTSKNPGIVTIKYLCDGLGISLYDFFNTEDFRNKEQEMK